MLAFRRCWHSEDAGIPKTLHSGEVYGQLTVYYRVAGLVPPESRPKKK
jgi:hypothetical protein